MALKFFLPNSCVMKVPTPPAKVPPTDMAVIPTVIYPRARPASGVVFVL